jgi:hypothetical protein
VENITPASVVFETHGMHEGAVRITRIHAVEIGGTLETFEKKPPFGSDIGGRSSRKSFRRRRHRDDGHGTAEHDTVAVDGAIAENPNLFVGGSDGGIPATVISKPDQRNCYADQQQNDERAQINFERTCP